MFGWVRVFMGKISPLQTFAPLTRTRPVAHMMRVSHAHNRRAYPRIPTWVRPARITYLTARRHNALGYLRHWVRKHKSAHPTMYPRVCVDVRMSFNHLLSL